ncbi:MAG TPA: SCP2 sterol-binding domain-containing protein [Saprospiraceae bacterium]|nr:SCP2 sterol-binding domain-containing protein [Saprospiraceae bacterium]HMQ85061.1 SCP2 sterol-binding domain-containing protein [Saprospiraceae bacterium]
MTLEEITKDIRDISDRVEPIGAAFKFVFHEGGIIHVDGSGDTTIVTNEDGEAQCALKMKMETYEKLKTKKLSATMALMLGKVKVEGDMGLALKLQNYI